MAENLKKETSTANDVSAKTTDNAVVLRIPKPNLQIVVLGLIAVITLFQTFQLVRIGSSATSASVKVAAPATTTANPASGAGSNTSVPQSQVGGC